jgi:RNA polymerase sigma-70 factor, ECF subfamily
MATSAVGGGESREQRFTALFTNCYGPVLAFARRRLGPDLAQDVVAETFLTAWRRIDELTDEPLPWLYRVASHAIANQRRGLARRQRLADRARRMSGDPAVPDYAESVAETNRLAAAFEALGERDREVLRLVSWEGLGSAEAAAVLGCSMSAFKVRLHRARRRLSRSLGERGRGHDPRPPREAALPWEETLS